MKQPVNVIWFKRDLRLRDHKPLQLAVDNGLPAILLYCFEPSLLYYGDSSERHWRFVYQSLQQMQLVLKKFNSVINLAYSEAIIAFEKINDFFSIKHIFSHEETGNQLSYDRDKRVKEFCKKQQIKWIESPTNGVIRGLKNRKDFSKHWHTVMHAPIFNVNLENLKTIDTAAIFPSITENESFYKIITTNHPFLQPGGEENGNAYLKSFLGERKNSYSKHISKPLESRKSCSRISPYLTWGNLSMKQIYQAAVKSIEETGDKFNINFFISRLHWHCHFIQKFESECRMEFENLNKGFDKIRTVENETFTTAWKNGETGYPLVDACMKCVIETGYLNFRMRSMLVSFLTHHLWQPWQSGVHHLAKQFLDYEPGIHYPQFQMQAGTMGVNTIRTYNPIKQSKDHDSKGIFIKKWIAALQHVPENSIHEPWMMTEIEQELYQCKIGRDYPAPIVDLKTAAAFAREHLWGTKKSREVQKNNENILAKHTKRKNKNDDNSMLFDFA